MNSTTSTTSTVLNKETHETTDFYDNKYFEFKYKVKNFNFDDID